MEYLVGGQYWYADKSFGDQLAGLWTAGPNSKNLMGHLVEDYNRRVNHTCCDSLLNKLKEIWSLECGVFVKIVWRI